MIRPADWWLLGLATPAAARFGVPTAAASLPMREATELFPDWAADPRQSLRIGLGCSLHLGRAGQLIAEFRKACPDVDLSLADVDDLRAAEGLQREGMDAALLVAGQVPGGLRSAGLWREPLIAAIPATHPLASSEIVDPVALRHETILMAGDARGDGGLERAVACTLGAVPITFIRHQVERDTLFDLVALNFGVALAPGVATSATHPGVRFRPIASTSAQVDYRLLWKPSNRNPALHAFTRVARAFSHQRDPRLGAVME